MDLISGINAAAVGKYDGKVLILDDGSVCRASPRLGWNGRVGRQSRLSSSSSTTEDDGIFINSASSKLLERAHDILMSVTARTHQNQRHCFSPDFNPFNLVLLAISVWNVTWLKRPAQLNCP